MLKINEIKELVSQFDQSTLTEFDLKDGQFELYMNKNEMSRGMGQTVPTTSASEPQPQQVVPALPKEESYAVQPEAVAPTIDGTEVKSPIVGIVYLQPSPDKPAFKKVGDKVAKGEVICIIEAMKLMNEVTSDVDGEIVAILIDNEEVVEYGQPLFIIQPN
ncbi:acetyl-CoA carboxylase biotin carboxyl carrier protein [Enterococcus mundtii]|nr:acetyl-CoA carboxylase biotin carboxyl carrier protein [Enterococcus mundtii]PTO44220.1 acetyl-CoA carboxylase biotin carboxyl carrier protein [Enterococcus mundtii]